jgi:hypothetical protein
VLESDPQFPVSCAEAGAHAAEWAVWVKFYTDCAGPVEDQQIPPEATESGSTDVGGSDAVTESFVETAAATGQIAATRSDEASTLEIPFAGGDSFGLVPRQCPAAADLAATKADAQKSLNSWQDYQKRVCEASRTAAGSAGIKTDTGDYDWYNNNCHDAANCGVDAGPKERTGIVRCIGSAGPHYAGHALNYVIGPCMVKSAGCQTVCLFEPQAGQDSNQCCWEQPVGAINLQNGKGQMCADQKCMGGNQGKQDVLPPGQKLPKDRPTDCRDTMYRYVKTGTKPMDVQRQRCSGCCDEVGARWTVYINDYQGEVRDRWEASRLKYVSDCKAACSQ